MADRESPDIVQEARDKFKVCVSAEQKQREREIAALKFQVPDMQWPDEIKQARKSQTVGNVQLASKPMLSIPKLDQPLQLVLNQEKAAYLGVNIHPLNEEADDETAEMLQGLYRAIEVDSRASLARSWAFERFVKAGRGVYRILKEYDDTSDHPSDQKIVISRIYEQGCVYFDPAATQPDGSDAEYVLEVEDIPWPRYKRLYPKSGLASYSEDEFTALGNEHAGWISGEKESRAIRVCAYWRFDYSTETVEWDGGSREREKRTVCCYKVNAIEEVEPKQEWDGQYLPFVQIARQIVPFDGEKRCVGLIEPNMDAQRMFNYAASASVEMAALESKASIAVDPEQIEDYKEWWNQRNTRNFPYLPYRRFINDKDYGPPVPVQADMSKMQVNALLLTQASDFIHAGTSTFEPSLGNNTPNVRTKGATLALQQQSEQANSHWIQIEADSAMTQEAKIVLDLIPHVYDRPGRVARILDVEDTAKTVMLNAPFVMNGKRPRALPMGTSQEQQMAQRAVMDPNHPAKQYDLNKGRYGITVTIGKAYKSRLDQGRDQLGQLAAADPEMFKIFGDIYFKYSDIPGHTVIADRFKKMLPSQLQETEGQDDPRVKLEQAEAALQHAQQVIQELSPERIKADVQIKTTEAKAQADVEIARMNNAAKILVARITATKEAASEAQEDVEERLALASSQVHEAAEAELDRSHERDMAQAQAQHDAALAAQGAQHETAMAAAGAAADAGEADKGRAHEKDMGERSHRQNLETGAQGIQGQIAVAKAKPKPQPKTGQQ